MDCPPRSKKSSCTPTRSTPSTSLQSAASRSSSSVARRHVRRGGRRLASGSGSARRSSLPLVVRGSASTQAKRPGTIVLREPLAQVRAQLGRGGGSAAPSADQPRGQPPLGARLAARGHRRLGHGRVRGERLPPPRPARCGSRAPSPARRRGPGTPARRRPSPAPQVERAVHPRARRAERVGEEALGGERRPPARSRAPPPRPPPKTSPGTPTPAWPQPRVEHVRRGRRRSGGPMVTRPSPRGQQGAGGVGGVFGGPVEVAARARTAAVACSARTSAGGSASPPSSSGRQAPAGSAPRAAARRRRWAPWRRPRTARTAGSGGERVLHQHQRAAPRAACRRSPATETSKVTEVEPSTRGALLLVQRAPASRRASRRRSGARSPPPWVRRWSRRWR